MKHDRAEHDETGDGEKLLGARNSSENRKKRQKKELNPRGPKRAIILRSRSVVSVPLRTG